MTKDRPELVAMSVRNDLRDFIRTALADAETAVDSGGGLGAEDIHFTHQGRRMHVQVKWPKDDDVR